MKRLIVILMVALFPLMGGAQQKSKVIAPEKAPVAALEMVRTSSPEETVQQVLKQKGKVYEFYLSDSTVLSFNRKGLCFQIKNVSEGLREGLVPDRIVDIIGTAYPGKDIKVVRLRKGEKEWKLWLSNGQIAGFNSDFKVTGQGFEQWVKEGQMASYRSSYDIFEEPREELEPLDL